MGKFQESSGRGGGRFLTAKIACFGVQWGLTKAANERKTPNKHLQAKMDVRLAGKRDNTLGTVEGTADTGGTQCLLGIVACLVLVLEEQKKQEATASR